PLRQILQRPASLERIQQIVLHRKGALNGRKIRIDQRLIDESDDFAVRRLVGHPENRELKESGLVQQGRRGLRERYADAEAEGTDAVCVEPPDQLTLGILGLIAQPDAQREHHPIRRDELGRMSHLGVVRPEIGRSRARLFPVSSSSSNSLWSRRSPNVSMRFLGLLQLVAQSRTGSLNEYPRHTRASGRLDSAAREASPW